MEKTHINIAPSWRTCVRIYCAVLRDPASRDSECEDAKQELLRLADYVTETPPIVQQLVTQLRLLLTVVDGGNGEDKSNSRWPEAHALLDSLEA